MLLGLLLPELAILLHDLGLCLREDHELVLVSLDSTHTHTPTPPHTPNSLLESHNHALVHHKELV